MRRSAADWRVARADLSAVASASASARRGVSGNARRNESMIASGAAGSSMAESDRGLGLDGSPAFVMTRLLVRGFDFLDGRGESRSLVLELA